MSKVEELQALLPDLSESVLDQMLTLARESHGAASDGPKIVPVKLGGLWKGVEISEEDIREMRREVWAGFGEGRDLE
jgi:hypothetical protein